MKRALRWLGVLLSLFCLAFFLKSAAPHWDIVRRMDWNAGTSAIIAVALLTYMATYAAASLGWQSSLGIVNARVRFREVMRVLALSQFAKYLPGNVAHHVGRAVLAKGFGISLESAVASMAIDIGIVLAAAVICCLPAVGLIRVVLVDHGISTGRVSAAAIVLAMMVSAFLAISPQARNIARRQVAFAIKACHWGNAPLVARAGIAHCLGFALGASALYLVCSAFAGSFTNDWPAVIGAYTVSWLLGFVIIGAPAGIGIREVALLLGLTPLYGEQNALAATAVLRLITTSGDGLMFLLGSLLSRRARRSIRD